MVMEDIIGVFESTYLDIKINFENIYSKVYKKLNLRVEQLVKYPAIYNIQI